MQCLRYLSSEVSIDTMNKHNITLALKVFAFVVAFGIAGIAVGFAAARLADGDNRSSLIRTLHKDHSVHSDISL